MTTDPVCGMEIDPNQAVATSDYMGDTYYFCSETCKDQFEMNPEAYAQTAVAA